MAKLDLKKCMVDIQYASDAIEAKLRPVAPKVLIQKWVHTAIDHTGSLTLRFVNRTEGRELNAQFRGKDYATNVLTFTYQHSKKELVADIVICLPVVSIEAREQSKTLKAHLAHLIIHGCLHATGHDHENQREADKMEARECAILKSLGFSNPYI